MADAGKPQAEGFDKTKLKQYLVPALAVAKAYQDATGHHLKRPPQETWVAEKKDEKKEEKKE